MHHSSSELTSMFFSDLKKYNVTNFKTVASANLEHDDPVVHKSFSATITRFFIFEEKHPEVTDAEMKMLYYKLKLDMVARYFASYPAANLDDLKPFQQEVKSYVESTKKAVTEK